MATHKSAEKRARQSAKRNARNRSARSALRTALKKFRALLAEKNVEQAAAEYGGLQTTIDKAVTKGVLHANAAARHKSRLHAALKRVQAA
ncbi:MAG: 30S ribosomal protein S20 [Candidatus Lambdaproteobacteria bacterium]|nr:30S ribosomal protein S20 [Candidatus Lambdaproteobacteria bacterium]